MTSRLLALSGLDALRFLHVLAGTAALVIAPIAMLARNKWAPLHKNAGRLYTCAMLAVVVTSIVLAVFTSKIFLLVVGVFSGYLALSGWRTVLRRGKPGTAFDYLLLSLFAASGLAMLILAANAAPNARPILLTFAAVITGFSLRQATTLPKPQPLSVYLPLHLASMAASYLAALTAFSVTQLHFIKPLTAQWLWPIALGLPLIVATSLKWKRILRTPSAAQAPTT